MYYLQSYKLLKVIPPVLTVLDVITRELCISYGAHTEFLWDGAVTDPPSERSKPHEGSTHGTASVTSSEEPPSPPISNRVPHSTLETLS